MLQTATRSAETKGQCVIPAKLIMKRLGTTESHQSQGRRSSQGQSEASVIFHPFITSTSSHTLQSHQQHRSADVS